MEIRTIGLETFLPCVLLFESRRDMKNSNDTLFHFTIQRYIKVLCLFTFFTFLVTSCGNYELKSNTIVGEVQHDRDTIQKQEIKEAAKPNEKPIQLGIERFSLYLDSLSGKRIAVVANQTSVVKKSHLVDTLIAMKMQVVKVFSPEHGFRGDADAGERVNSSVDEKTGIPIVSLYGNNKKPSAAQMADVDIVLFDIQDVGVRFYTFISTLHYVMEACAENNKKLIVLDRPNPNAHYVDGPVLEYRYKSFVGMHPVPIVYGMTIGEYAKMINGEGWLDNKKQCDLTVIPCKNYTHKTRYSLPIAPSPNLKSDVAIALYPSLCLFEATTVSVGRGTDRPFEYFGHPRFPKLDHTFTPEPKVGAKNPMHKYKLCNGFDLSKSQLKRTYELNLNYLIQSRDLLGDSAVFIDQNLFFNRLAGTASLKEQIYKGWSAQEIKETWKPGISSFMDTRKKYLLYP